MSVQLSPLFSNGMVLQRDTIITLWGTADEPVTVSFQGRVFSALPDEQRRWSVRMDGLISGGPFLLSINEHALRDVYVGDVWLCAGQSNMQLPMARVRHRYPEAMLEENETIRQFAAPQRTDFHAPQQSLDGGCWVGATVQNIPDFTAVGLFFAKRLQARYGVPIGLLQTAVGGTPIHSWMGRDALSAFPDLLQTADRFSDDAYVETVTAENLSSECRFVTTVDADDPGLRGEWWRADHDDSAWETRSLLCPFEGTGSVWLRKKIPIPSELAGRPATLYLGTVVDRDTVYINGRKVGETAYRYPPREYVIPALPEGCMTIAIRVIHHSGGGFTPGKPYHLFTERGSILLSDGWKFSPGAKAHPPREQTNIQRQPTGLFNGMIAPLMRYAIRGVIWYQGESDAHDPARYAEKFMAMVRHWRQGWGYPFPFLSVELAHWAEGEADFAALRREQLQTLCLANTAIAAAADLGEYNDLHPQGKRPVAERLARCAMRLAYGEKLPASPFELIAY